MIDAHVHIWRLGRNGCAWPTPDLAAIHRDFGLEDAAAIVAGTGVDHIVLVQSQESAEDTAWLLAQAAASPLVAGVVGWVEPSADPRQRIIGLQRQGPLVGLRVMAQERAADWLADPAVHGQARALAERGLSLDLLIRPLHLPGCAALAEHFPGLPMIIDHLAKPPVARDGLATWREAIAPLAERPNMMCKLSGLITEAAPGATMETLAPYVETALDLFGPERLMWGSDWPVILLNGAYADWLELARSIIPETHHRAVFAGNARRFYRLAA